MTQKTSEKDMKQTQTI